MRRLALGFLGAGITREMVAIAGMVLGILAGVSFMGTGEPLNPELFWSLGLAFCLLRIVTTRIDTILEIQRPRDREEDVFFIELPERVSDAVTLIGFGFAIDSSPWLGLAAALAAIFSAYTRSIAVLRGARRETAASGPMTRIHRLFLVSTASTLMLIDPLRDRFSTPVPQIALWVIFFGCLLTIAIRWLRIPVRVLEKRERHRP